LLDEIGEADDVAVLRAYARRARRASRQWGDALTRRLAPRLWIDDLGLTDLTIGGQQIVGRDIRRKALALLAFLVAQPGGSATPDQLIEGLWPDLDPDAALNSMHQTIYFLRRVFDSGYRAGVSAEYLHVDSDVVWLDRDLVDCRSWQCRTLLARRSEDQASVEQLLGLYSGRFATEFSYEEWASAYRDSLHAQYLSVVERAISGALGPFDPRWRLWVGQRALQVDPTADGIEALVIRLYRVIGAAAAAAEQYEHYAATLRQDLGIEPPTLDEL
jgi:LuxR family maltose regulon positive regulatory protein